MYGHVRNGFFAHNTFVNTGGIDIHIGASYKANWDRSQRVLIPENNTIANNLIYKTNDGTAIAIPQQDESEPLNVLRFQLNIFMGNIVSGGKIDLQTKPSGILEVDNPGLSFQEGLYKLKESSPAIDHAVAFDDSVKVDFEGQPRPDQADVGADEYSSAEITHRPLMPQDVGPEWMK
jgi:poly(beta-D-mannuronate) lyase